LIELAVASFLFLIVLGLTSSALTAGIKNYLGVRGEIELQQDAIVMLSRMAREMGEADPAATWPPPVVESELTPPPGQPVGVVFSSARDNQGKLLLDFDSKQPIWQKRICYLFDPAQEKLLRSVDPLTVPTDSPPEVDLAKTTGWFREARPQDPMPGRVRSFTIKVGKDTDSFNLDIQVSGSSLGRTTTLQFLGHSTMRG